MEKWKDIPWYEWKYQVSDLWNVRNSKLKILSWWNQNWYIIVWLSKDWKATSKTIHRLVALTFLWPCLEWKEVNHIDWNKSNNKLENLEYTTKSENHKHRFRVLWHKWSMYWKFWKNNHSSKRVGQFDLDWNFIREWESLSLAVKKYSCSIWDNCRWKTNQSKGFIWRFI